MYMGLLWSIPIETMCKLIETGSLQQAQKEPNATELRYTLNPISQTQLSINKGMNANHSFYCCGNHPSYYQLLMVFLGMPLFLVTIFCINHDMIRNNEIPKVPQSTDNSLEGFPLSNNNKNIFKILKDVGIVYATTETKCKERQGVMVWVTPLVITDAG